jgi:hypothetical protein
MAECRLWLWTVFRKKMIGRTRDRLFVEKEILEGKRSDFTGKGFLRSISGWTVLKGLQKAGILVKGDERILGDNDFVKNALKYAEEELERKYNL